jgi:CRISPR/Cas system CSM-associated protein Csm5 (group 7 of RAMP superfamily)
MKRYLLTLETIGPVHIGSGQLATQKEYLQLAGGNLFFPDLGRLYLSLPDERLRQEFEEFIRSQEKGGGRHGDAAKRLGDWLCDKGVSEVPDAARDLSRVVYSGLQSRNTAAQATSLAELEAREAARKELIGHLLQSGFSLSKNEQRQILLWHKENDYPATLLNGGSIEGLKATVAAFLAQVQPVAQTTQTADINWRIDASEGKSKGKSPLSDIHFCMRDPLTYQPYIPGSSLKGALRSAVLGYLVHKRAIDLTKHESTSKTAGEPLETELLRTLALEDAKGKAIQDKVQKDIFRALRVADSALIDPAQVMLCTKHDKLADATPAFDSNHPDVFHANGRKTYKDNQGHVKSEENPHSLNLVREAIKPGTRIRFDVTIDETLLNGQNLAIDLASIFEGDRLSEILNQNYTRYSDSYLKRFGEDGPSDGCLYLGGGAGFHSKTVLIHGNKGIEITQRILNKLFYNKKATSSRNHKTYYSDKSQPVGPTSKKGMQGRLFCSCEKDHSGNKRLNASKRNKSETRLLDDLADFGTCPRCLKLSRSWFDDGHDPEFYEMGKCRLTIEKAP